MKKLTAQFFYIFSSLLLPTEMALAVQINTTIPGYQANGSQPVPCSIIFGFYTFALMIGGVLAFAAITYGGVKYTLAAGNPSGQGEGKEWVKGALYGLLLLVGAYLVLHTVNPDITNCGLKALTPV
jgi:hypothetical protein